MPPTPRDPRYHVKGNDPHNPKERAPVPTKPQAPEKENDQKKPEEKSLVRYGQNPYMEIVNQYNSGYCPLLIPKPKTAEPEKYDFSKPPGGIFLDMMYVGCTITMAKRKNPLVDMAYFAAIICPSDDYWLNTRNIQMFCNDCEKTGEYWVLQKGKGKIIKDLEDVSGLSNWLHFLETTQPKLKTR
ncbi:hypothetical protein MMC22_003160 [Lobaria immixta]|nr:hypothetical protein [Lobaria immixta]